MSERTSGGQGSAAWVAARLTALSGDEDWAASPACRELIDWLYTVVRRRVGVLGLPVHERGDVAQDAMTPIIRALSRSRARYAAANNPAAVLERVAARAVAEGRHQARMAGLGGVPANGQNWRARFPRRIGGEAARRILEELPTPTFTSSGAVEDAALRASAWVTESVGVTLVVEAMDALVYVLDRLVAGVSRAALLRGGHSGLRSDPAMRHLGFTPPAASAFGVWLLGRHDAQHNAPSVLDAALSGDVADRFSVERWRRDAVKFGFAVDRDGVNSARHDAGGRWSA